MAQSYRLNKPELSRYLVLRWFLGLVFISGLVAIFTDLAENVWFRQGFAWDDFAASMWAKHRTTLAAPTDGWKQKHDDAYYRAAIEKGK